MGVKPDRWIEDMALACGMIEPFERSQVSQRKVSFGLSSYGYDFRLADVYSVPPSESQLPLDPKEDMRSRFKETKQDHFLLDPGAFVLGRSLEYFRIPRDVLTICSGKSTYARCGVLVNVTPFEPEWEGHATLSISNTGRSPVKLYSGEGIAQLVFLSADGICRTSYADRKGKYQAQKGIVVSQVGAGASEDD